MANELTAGEARGAVGVERGDGSMSLFVKPARGGLWVCVIKVRVEAEWVCVASSGKCAEAGEARAEAVAAFLRVEA